MRATYLLPIILLGFFSCRLPEPRSEKPRPNILLIVSDDQAWGDLSLHGNPVLETPALDSLGLQSLRFSRFYVSPYGALTRAALLTGRYPLRTGVSGSTHRREVMRTTEVTLAEYLLEAGYRTALFGKWHNGNQYPEDASGQGFETFFGFNGGHLGNYFDARLRRGQDTVQTKGFVADVLTDSAIAFMQRHREEAFFNMVAFPTPHSPLQVPNRYFRRYRQWGMPPEQAAVYGMCANLDENVGRLLGALDSLGLAANTIVLFLSDNGPQIERFNAGLKGKKGEVEEGGLRVPCFLRWPGRIPAGRVLDLPLAHIDLLPTLLELAGIQLNPVLPLDGRSLVPLFWKPELSWPQRLLFAVQTIEEGRPFPGSVRGDRFGLFIGRDSIGRLFDLVVDPGQTTDLAGKFPRVLDSLRQAYFRWFNEVSEAGMAPTPIPIGYPLAPLAELPATESRLYGELVFKGDKGWANDYLLNWLSPADSAVWTLLPAEAGWYEVWVEYASRASAVGTPLIVGSGDQLVQGQIGKEHYPPFLYSPDRAPRAEVYEKRWARMLLGPLFLNKGIQTLRLYSGGPLAPGSLEIKALWLKKTDRSGLGERLIPPG